MISLYIRNLKQEAPPNFFTFNNTFAYGQISAFHDRKQPSCIPNFQPAIHIIVLQKKKKLSHTFKIVVSFCLSTGTLYGTLVIVLFFQCHLKKERGEILV